MKSAGSRLESLQNSVRNVAFPDKKLEVTVLKALEKHEWTLTRMDLKKLHKLHVIVTSSKYLSGLGNAVNLNELMIMEDNIDNISPLALLTYLTGRHTIFGRVLEDQDVVQVISRLPTNAEDRPV